MPKEEKEKQVQVNLANWSEGKKHQQTIEELFDGNVRYLKLIKEKFGEAAAIDGFHATTDFTFNKNMSGLMKMGDKYLKSVAKTTLLKKLLINFFINMQHVVDLNCIQKFEFSQEGAEIIVEGCTGKMAWIKGLKNNKATDVFTADDYCKYTCIPTVSKFLDVANAKNHAEIHHMGCHQKISFVE